MANERVDREADLPDAPERSPEAERVPEELMRPCPFSAATHDDAADRKREREKKPVCDDRPGKGKSSQGDPEAEVHGGIDDAENEVSQSLLSYGGVRV